MRRLPNLNGVKAFEAAARLGGFAAAGEEMNISPAAVSRAVRLLEESLRVRLFRRLPSKLVLTAAGETYRTGLTPVLDALAMLTDQIRQDPAPRALTVGVGPTFAIRWLIPRLARFRAVEPNIDVRIATGGAAAPFADDWTCGIRLGEGGLPGLAAERLFDAALVPVCAPEQASGCRAPRDLRPEMLIRVRHAVADWPTWLAAAGIGRVRAGGPTFDFYHQAMRAALDGFGFALGLRPYVDDDLASGRLVAPFPLVIPKGAHWNLIYAPDRRREPAFQAFRSWLLAEAQAVGPQESLLSLRPELDLDRVG